MPMRYIFYLFITILGFVATPGIYAEDTEEDLEEEVIVAAEYIEIKPSIVTNFISEALRYVKVDVALKVRGMKAKRAVYPHKPRLQHIFIYLISRQPLESISSVEGRMILKELALEEINAALAQEDPDAFVEEVLFTGFLIE